MQSASVPGVSISVTTADEMVYADGIGSRDYQSNRPATPETLYGIASCTKSFTAAAIMQLAEEDDLELSDSVIDHLPHNIWADQDDITIHDLLTHSSGIPGDGMAYLLIARQLGVGGEVVPLGDELDLVEFVDDFGGERAAPSGETFHYQNSGYMLLGEIIEHHTGRPFAEYVDMNILDPLGMDRSTFEASEIEADDNVLTPYLVEDGEPIPSSFPFDELVHAAGGLLSNPVELAAYLRMYLNDGVTGDPDTNGARVLEPSSIERMHRGYVEWDYGMSSSTNHYGYGWTTKQFRDRTVLSHIGDIVVSSAYLGLVPEEDLGIAITANRSPEYILQCVGEAVLAILFGDDPTEVVPFFSVRDTLDRLTGEYATYRGIVSGSLTREGTSLRFESDAPPALDVQLIPEPVGAGEYSFYIISEEGKRKPVAISEDGENVSITIGRWVLHKRR